jgi:hypothetical protein
MVDTSRTTHLLVFFHRTLENGENSLHGIFIVKYSLAV